MKNKIKHKLPKPGCDGRRTAVVRKSAVGFPECDHFPACIGGNDRAVGAAEGNLQRESETLRGGRGVDVRRG